jgi:hypothetical protein
MSGTHRSVLDPLSRQDFSFLILGLRVHVHCTDASFARILLASFGAMAVAEGPGRADLEYRIPDVDAQGTFRVIREGCAPIEAQDYDDLLFILEKDVVIELQRRRDELYFLHSAVLERQGRAFLFAADSGGGKSTTTWGLLHHGFRYLSDELAPVAVEAMTVWPYTRALCLKQRPPAPYALPDDAIDLGRTLHVPAAGLPSSPIADPLPIGGAFFVEYRAELKTPELRSMAPSEAGARLYVAALNALAHPNRGLDAALRIAERVPCFQVGTADLAKTCAAICATVAEVSRP